MVASRRKKVNGQTSRNVLAYFVESFVWRNYKRTVTESYTYWTENDPLRAEKMYKFLGTGKLGITVDEYIYDMIDCVYSSRLKPKTKQRLYTALDELERYHIDKGTEKDIL